MERTRSLTVRERILLHLYDKSRFAEAYEAPVEVTQAGIATAVGIRGSHFQQYTRPLVGEHLVEERTSHVIHHAGRRKVYFLTDRGRHQVASLRASLLNEEVQLKTRTGGLTPISLAKAYEEARRGSTLLALVQEASENGHIEAASEAEGPSAEGFTQERPNTVSFYGRKLELEAVLRAIEEKPIVVVTGFAGIGKSTLGAKVCEMVDGTRALFWRRIRVWDTATDLASRVASFLKAHGKTALDSVLNLEAQDLAQFEKPLVSDLGSLRPLLIFDDVHCASESARALLSLLSQVLRSHKAGAALFLSREAPGFYSQSEVVVEGSVFELTLGGLDKKSSAALLTDARMPSPTIRRLVEQSGGNPLFLQLFAKADPRTAVVEGWRSIATYVAQEIEPSLRNVERDCLEAASLYEIPVPAQGLLVEGRARTSDLIGLRRKGLLDQFGTDRYVLHDALKEYFRESMGTTRRKALESMIVAWLSDQGDDMAGRGEPMEALSYLNNAATLERNRSRWASIMERMGELHLHMVGNQSASAERAFRAALQEVTEPRARARLHEKIAHALQYASRYEEAYREIDRGLELLRTEPVGIASTLFARKSDIDLETREFDRAEESVVRAGEIADRLSDDALRAEVAFRRAKLRTWDAARFDIAAIEADCQLAEGFFERVQNEWRFDGTLGVLARALIRTARSEEALAILERLAPHTQASGVIWNRLERLRTRAFVLMNYRGDFGAAEADLEEALRLAKRAGLPLPFLETHSDLAKVRRLQGRDEEARELLEYYLRMTATGELYRLTTTWVFGGRLNDLTLMVRLCARCGDAASGEKYFREALELGSSRPSEMSAFELAWAEASLRAASGQLRPADESYRLALEQPTPFIPERMGHEDEPRAESMLEYGRFLASIGEHDRAKTVLAGALQIGEKRSMKPLEREILVAMSTLGR